MKVIPISFNILSEKYHISLCDPWHSGVFTEADLQLHRTHAGILSPSKKLSQIINTIPHLVRTPIQTVSRFHSLLSTQVQSMQRYYAEKNEIDIMRHPFADHTLKSSIIAAWKPTRLLEIGTGFGWGIVAFKSVLPKCECITMSPRLDEETGALVRQKKQLGITQIWADSLTYDFNKIDPVDVTYIDGNHTYRYVLADLFHAKNITKKMIMLDDYIPSSQTTHGDVNVYASFHDEVRNAVHDFLEYCPTVISHAYWVRDTRICLLLVQ